MRSVSACDGYLLMIKTALSASVGARNWRYRYLQSGAVGALDGKILSEINHQKYIICRHVITSRAIVKLHCRAGSLVIMFLISL